MTRARRVALQPLRFSTLCACGVVLAFMAVGAGTAEAQQPPPIDPDEFLIYANSFGGVTHIAEFRASFFVRVQQPMPHWVPIDALQDVDVPHKGSVQVYPQYYQHTYSEVYGPVDAEPPDEDFAGFQADTLYRVEVKRRDPGQTEFVAHGEFEWTHGQ
jgi:hypothetical protein